MSTIAPAAHTTFDPEAFDALALENQVCFALAVASRGVIGAYRDVLEPLGLTHPQYLVMLSLWGESPQSLGSIARALQLEPATLSPLLRRLEASGYVERRRNPLDERSLAIELTASGTALREQALGVPPRIVEKLGVPIDELEALRDQLKRVIANLAS